MKNATCCSCEVPNVQHFTRRYFCKYILGTLVYWLLFTYVTNINKFQETNLTILRWTTGWAFLLFTISQIRPVLIFQAVAWMVCVVSRRKYKQNEKIDLLMFLIRLLLVYGQQTHTFLMSNHQRWSWLISCLRRTLFIWIQFSHYKN